MKRATQNVSGLLIGVWTGLQFVGVMQIVVRVSHLRNRKLGNTFGCRSSFGEQWLRDKLSYCRNSEEVASALKK
jgi:hypothetical protein